MEENRRNGKRFGRSELSFGRQVKRSDRNGSEERSGEGVKKTVGRRNADQNDKKTFEKKPFRADKSREHVPGKRTFDKENREGSAPEKRTFGVDKTGAKKEVSRQSFRESRHANEEKKFLGMTRSKSRRYDYEEPFEDFEEPFEEMEYERSAERKLRGDFKKDYVKASVKDGVRNFGKKPVRPERSAFDKENGKPGRRTFHKEAGRPERKSFADAADKAMLKARGKSFDRENTGTETVVAEKPEKKQNVPCPIYRKCGSCCYLNLTYQEQLNKKQKMVEGLLSKYGKVNRIIGMKDPYYYRNKVHAVFDRDVRGNIICGTYEADSHRVVSVENCLLEDKKAQEIIHTIRDLCKSFKIKTYDEDTDYGLLRHVIVRRGFQSGEIMVILVLADPILPSKNNFVKALRQVHPEITSVVINVNDKQTSMVLGDRDIPLYGPAFIKDTLCDTKFRISPRSFYQVNPVQTEILYNKAMEYADLKGTERVLDAYCGIGTISLVAARHAAEVIGVELNNDAVKDARLNAKENEIKNASFYQGDAGDFLIGLAEEGEKLDTVFMDPPRTGSTKEFIESVAACGPKKVVYVSCGPETLARDLGIFVKRGYKVRAIQPVDMFPWTEHVEVVTSLVKK